MQETTKNIIPRLLKFSGQLNQTEKLIDKPWIIVEGLYNQKLIFRQNKELLCVSNGTVKVGKWEYIAGLSSVLLELPSEKILLKSYFVDNSLMILLKETGGMVKNHVIFVNEDDIPNLDYERYLIELGSSKNIGGLIVGQKHGGGIVFHVETNGSHGLIVAEQDITYKRPEPYMYNVLFNPWWAPNGNKIPAMENKTDGFSNSNRIIAAVKEITEPFAAKSCRDFRGGGFNDWYLPAIDQLRILYNSGLISGRSANYHYWSSNSSSYDMAQAINFANGKQEIHYYPNGFILRELQTPHVRPIRSF